MKTKKIAGCFIFVGILLALVLLYVIFSPKKEKVTVSGNGRGSDPFEQITAFCTETRELPSSEEVTIGEWLSSGQQISNVSFCSTADQTPLIYTYDGNVNFGTGTCSNCWGYYGKEISDVKISDSTFENMSGMNLTACSDIVIENCYFQGCENGIYLNGCSNVIIRNCTFCMNATGLVNYYQGIYLCNDNQNITVENCLFTADAVIHKPFRTGSVDGDTVGSSEILFENCLVFGKFSCGFQNLGCENVTLKDCDFYFQEIPESEEEEKIPVIVENNASGINTVVENCRFFTEYEKKGTNGNTVFTNCALKKADKITWIFEE